MDRLRELPPAGLVLAVAMAGFLAVQLGAVSRPPGDAVAVSAPNTTQTATTPVASTVGTTVVQETTTVPVETTDAATSTATTAVPVTRRPTTTARPRTTQAPATTAAPTTVEPVATPSWSPPVESTTSTTAAPTTTDPLPESTTKPGSAAEVWVTSGPDGWHGVLTAAANHGTIFSVRNSLEPAPRVFELSAGQAIAFSGGATANGESLTITVEGAVVYRGFYMGNDEESK